MIAEFRGLGVDDDSLAARLQEEAAASFAKSWRRLLADLQWKTEKLDDTLAQAHRP